MKRTVLMKYKWHIRFVSSMPFLNLLYNKGYQNKDWLSVNVIVES